MSAFGMSATKLRSYVLILWVLIAAANCGTELIEHVDGVVEATDALAACLAREGVANVTAANSSGYAQLLDFSVQNLRFSAARQRGVPTPALLILPNTPRQVQAAFNCTCLQPSPRPACALRVRSGGHSYEGLSYTTNPPSPRRTSSSSSPFVVIDLMNLNSVAVDADSRTAWVGGGATIGELYYAISKAAPGFGFPTGVCPTVGVGGHFSGGGFGVLSRKYGVSADNIIDAQLVDAAGRLLNRSSMGEDLFWAIRGGGGGNWGIVVAWKIALVPIPRVVTTFQIWRTGKDFASKLAYRWQTLGAFAPDEFYSSLYIQGITNSPLATLDVGISFSGMHLGNQSEALSIANHRFPELNATHADMVEQPWIQAVASGAFLATPSNLTNRQNQAKGCFKAKSDYVKVPISMEGLEGALDYMMKNPKNGYILLDAFGGEMGRISSHAIAYPHRGEVLYGIQYQALWAPETKHADVAFRMAWLRDVYAYMGRYVYHATLNSSNSTPNSPTTYVARAAYVNYIDLDIGDPIKAGYSYFLQNFPRLVDIKKRSDPFNVFKNSQSIPPHIKMRLPIKN